MKTTTRVCFSISVFALALAAVAREGSYVSLNTKVGMIKKNQKSIVIKNNRFEEFRYFSGEPSRLSFYTIAADKWRMQKSAFDGKGIPRHIKIQKISGLGLTIFDFYRRPEQNTFLLSRIRFEKIKRTQGLCQPTQEKKSDQILGNLNAHLAGSELYQFPEKYDCGDDSGTRQTLQSALNRSLSQEPSFLSCLKESGEPLQRYGEQLALNQNGLMFSCLGNTEEIEDCNRVQGFEVSEIKPEAGAEPAVLRPLLEISLGEIRSCQLKLDEVLQTSLLTSLVQNPKQVACIVKNCSSVQGEKSKVTASAKPMDSCLMLDENLNRLIADYPCCKDADQNSCWTNPDLAKLDDLDLFAHDLVASFKSAGLSCGNVQQSPKVVQDFCKRVSSQLVNAQIASKMSCAKEGSRSEEMQVNILDDGERAPSIAALGKEGNLETTVSEAMKGGYADFRVAQNVSNLPVFSKTLPTQIDVNETSRQLAALDGLSTLIAGHNVLTEGESIEDLEPLGVKLSDAGSINALKGLIVEVPQTSAPEVIKLGSISTFRIPASVDKVTKPYGTIQSKPNGRGNELEQNIVSNSRGQEKIIGKATPTLRRPASQGEVAVANSGSTANLRVGTSRAQPPSAVRFEGYQKAKKAADAVVEKLKGQDENQAIRYLKSIDGYLSSNGLQVLIPRKTKRQVASGQAQTVPTSDNYGARTPKVKIVKDNNKAWKTYMVEK